MKLCRREGGKSAFVPNYKPRLALITAVETSLHALTVVESSTGRWGAVNATTGSVGSLEGDSRHPNHARIIEPGGGELRQGLECGGSATKQVVKGERSEFQHSSHLHGFGGDSSALRYRFKPTDVGIIQAARQAEC